MARLPSRFAAPPLSEMLRAGLGAGLGLLMADLFMTRLAGAAPTQIPLIALFGATAFLICAVPNSPLAQPWSAIIGNTDSALTGTVLLVLTGTIWAKLTARRYPFRQPTTIQHHPPGPLQLTVALFCQHDHRQMPLLDRTRYVDLIPQPALLSQLPHKPDRRARPDNCPRLADLLTRFAKSRDTCLAVTEGDTLKGLITRSDLLAALFHANRMDPK